MPASFIDELPFPEEERRKLASLGAGTPLALLSIRKASREAFDRYFGSTRAEEITRHLESLLTDEQRESLRRPTSGAPGKLGASMDPLPRSDKPH